MEELPERNVHVIVYDKDFRNSLEIRKANGEKICIEEPTDDDKLEHHFFAWDEIDRRWEGVG